MSGDEGEIVWLNEMRMVVHTYRRLRRGFLNGSWPIQCQSIAKLIENSHRERLIRLL